MNKNSRLAFVLLFAAALSSATSTALALTLALDFQPTGGTTAPGFQAFEATNQTLPLAGTNYSAFGSTITVSLATSNLPDGALDFRAVARNGTANILTNDWIGVDTRNAGMNVTMTVNLAGLPPGTYSWLSTHHDGAPGSTAASNGNLSGMPDYSFTDASGVRTGILNLSSQLDNDPVSTFATTFRSNGVAPVSFSMIMDFAQGDVPGNALFAFINGVQISNIPEPASLVLIGLGLAGVVFARAVDNEHDIGDGRLPSLALPLRGSARNHYCGTAFARNSVNAFSSVIHARIDSEPLRAARHLRAMSAFSSTAVPRPSTNAMYDFRSRADELA